MSSLTKESQTQRFCVLELSKQQLSRSEGAQCRSAGLFTHNAILRLYETHFCRPLGEIFLGLQSKDVGNNAESEH